MIDYIVMDMKKEPLASEGGRRKVYVKLSLINAYVVDKKGNKSDVYETTFKSVTEYNRFKELCQREDVFSIGYESHFIRYKQWFKCKKMWVSKDRVYHPDFIVNL